MAKIPNTTEECGIIMFLQNEHRKPIIIQETYYNNAKQFRLLYKKAKSLNLKLRTIMQWPWEEGVKVTHYSVTYPEKYNNYTISK